MAEQTDIANLRARLKDLEAALAHARAVTEVERRRAVAAEESAHRAWKVSLRLS
jgi:hypothetical protein